MKKSFHLKAPCLDKINTICVKCFDFAEICFDTSFSDEDISVIESLKMSYYNDDYYDEDSADYYDNDEGSAEEPVDETGYRNTWEILTWIIIALTIILNLILIGILVLRRNLRSIINKSEKKSTRTGILNLNKYNFVSVIFVVAISDLIYGCIVSPFFVENYVKLDWERSIDYCR